MKCKMKVWTILLIFVSFWTFCFANEDLEFVGRVLQGTHQQVGYGFNLKPESQYPTVEYSPAVADLLRKGVKSLLLDRSDALTAGYSFSNVSQTCRNDTTTMLQDLLNRKPYAVSMFDADGKPGSGLEHGNFIWLGNVQECQQAQAEKFRGHMCNIVTNLGISQIGVSKIFGICFPDSCSSKEVQELVWEALQVIETQIKMLIYPTLVDCPAPVPYSTGDYFAIVICSIILVAAFIGTLADVVFMYLEENGTDEIKVRTENTPNYASIGSASVNEATERLGLLSNVPKNEVIYSENQIGSCCFGTLKQILLAFSVISNTRKLLNTSTASGSLTAINGMRVLSMFWVILGHTYAFNISVFDNILDMLPILKRFTFQCIMNGTYSVDTFFFMSGLLVSYTVLKKLRNQGKINWVMFYFHRFWRLTPVYAFFILIWTTLYKHMVWEGPYAISQKTGQLNQFDLCEKYWWTNLLYINNFWPNYGNIGKQCLGWGWYLANDMQFYILSPLFIILLNKTKALGTGGVLFGIFGCVVSRIITADYYGFRLPAVQTPVNHTHEVWAQSSPLYNKPYTRVAPFLVGIWLGYILVINSNRVRLAKKKLLIGWCIAITIGISVIYGLYGYYKDYPALHQGGKAASLLYIGLSRLAWSFALAWVIFVCAVGLGGPVNALLSWKAWAPLGRLTYCAYIVHPAVIFYFTFTYEKPLHYMEFTLIRLFLSILVISYGIAFILSILVEAPMLALEKILFRRWIR